MEITTGRSSGDPIYILGCPRSGTTLYRWIIDTHSHIACPPESSFLVKLAAIYETERCTVSLGTLGFSKEEVLDEMRKFTVHFMNGYAESKGKPRWADRTTEYVNHVDTIDHMYGGNVVYLGIVRHGLDVAYSLSQLDMGLMQPWISGVPKPIGCIRLWEDRTRKILDFGGKVGSRFHLIRYEDLTTDPRGTLMPVFEFLGEPWEDDVLRCYEFEHDPGYDDPKIHNYNGIVSRHGEHMSWPLEVQSKVYAEVAPLMEELGYGLIV